MCRSKGMAVRGPVRRGPALLGRMSASEPFDGTRATAALLMRIPMNGHRTRKRPAEPAFDRRKPPKSAFCPAEIVLSRMESRLLTTKTKPTGLLQATTLPTYTHIRKRVRPVFTGRTLRRTAATYSPTWWGSTIGDDGLSFSVRNGKRRFPVAIATAVYNLRENQRKKSSRLIFPERKISGY